MKIVLYINGKPTIYEKDIPSLEQQKKSIQQDRIRYESIRLRRIAERIGKDWQIVLEIESKVNGIEIQEIERPPSTYSNKSPMGIANP